VHRDMVDITKQIKAANDIVDVIGLYLPVLKGTGGKFKCLCPFHDDSNPSLTIDRKFQSYKCWPCGANGDVFTFIEKYEKVNFLEARAILARRVGISLEDSTPQDQHKTELLRVMKWAQELYQNEYLNGTSAEAARRYIGTRHISGATARSFGLGFAPPENGWLEHHARSAGIAQDLLIETGLLGVREENRGVWDKFRERVMFPIRDMQGRTVGFGGRVLPESVFANRGPKYYNTADTSLFTKSENIYGIDLARHAASNAGTLAVVEGYTDVMMAHQCGIANVVATMGTALNAKHIAQLRRYVPRIVLVFDADAGGLSGIDRALEVFIAHDLELAIATLPQGLDPADLLAQDGGAETFRNAIETATDALDFKLTRLMASESTSVDGIRRMLDGVLGMLALAPPVPNQATQLKRELILTRLAQRLGIEIRSVKSRLAELQRERKKYDRPEPIAASSAVEDSISVAVTLPSTPVAVPVNAASTAANDRKQAILERQLLQLLLAAPELVNRAVELIHPNEIQHTGLRRLLIELFALAEAGSIADLDGLRLRLLDRPDLATSAMALREVGEGIPAKASYFEKIIDGFADLRRDADARAVKNELAAVDSDDESAAVELLRRLQERSAGALGSVRT
jgi:DNA primase